MAVRTSLILKTDKPRVQYQIWKTGLVTLALPRTAGNPKRENLTISSLLRLNNTLMKQKEIKQNPRNKS